MLGRGLSHIALAAAAALAVTGLSYAQAPETDSGSGIRLQGPDPALFEDFSVAPLLDLLSPSPLSPAGEDGGEAKTQVADGLTALSPTEDTGAASALPWYERFTVSTPGQFNSAWGEEAATFEFSAGSRWNFTLGLPEQERGPQFGLDDMSAGASYDLNPRISVGTNFRFTSPTEDVFGEIAEEERVPELKFESAFRF